MDCRVECYAGFKGDERPIRFWLDDQAYEVREVLDRWYDPGCSYFKVEAEDGNLYILRRALSGGWSLEAFMRP